jgi:hypothetical protein
MAMKRQRDCKFLGYVKVELQSQSPRRWTWTVRRDTSDMVAFRSDAPYACAEDAWRAGQQVLTALEQGTMADRQRATAGAD